VYIAGTAGSGATPNTFVVKVTTTGDFIVDNTQFTLPAGSGNACQYVKIGTSSGTDILGATVTQSSSVAAWATAIATQINGFQSTYNACGVGSSVFVSKKVRASNDTFETQLTISLTTGTPTGNPSSGNPSSSQTLVATVSPASLTAVFGLSATVTSGVGTCSVSGGVAPFTYKWSQSNNLSGSFTLNIKSPTVNSTSVTIKNLDSQPFQHPVKGTVYLQCQVTDSSATPLVVLSAVLPVFVS